MSEKKLELESKVEKWRAGGYRAHAVFEGGDYFCIHEEPTRALRGVELAVLEKLMECQKAGKYEGIEEVVFKRLDKELETFESDLASKEDLDSMLRALRAVDFDEARARRLHRSVQLAQELSDLYDASNSSGDLPSTFIERAKSIGKLMPKRARSTKTYKRNTEISVVQDLIKDLFGSSDVRLTPLDPKDLPPEIASAFVASRGKGCGRPDCPACSAMKRGARRDPNRPCA